MEKTQGMPGYVRYILTDLLMSNSVRIMNILQYQTDYNDFIWPDFSLITGREAQIKQKQDILKSRNKWSFQSQVASLPW